MAQTKQKLVIKPKSVHVAQAFDIAFPVSEQSVFSDSYDWETERKRLSGLSDEESGHSDAAALEVLAAHEMLLKQHIMRQRIRSGRVRSRSIAAVDLDGYEIWWCPKKYAALLTVSSPAGWRGNRLQSF